LSGSVAATKMIVGQVLEENSCLNL